MIESRYEKDKCNVQRITEVRARIFPIADFEKLIFLRDTNIKVVRSWRIISQALK